MNLVKRYKRTLGKIGAVAIALLVVSGTHCRCSLFAVKVEDIYTQECKGRIMNLNRRLRQGTYEIWDEFNESKNYKFNVYHKEKDYDFFIELKTLKGEWQHIKQIIKNDLILRQHREVRFTKKSKKKVTIHGEKAYVVRYQRSDDYGLEYMVELCYIRLANDMILLVEGFSLKQFYDNGKEELKKFYMSYKPDLSQEYKTEYGSFAVVEGMRDSSYFLYTIGGPSDPHYFSIKINYQTEEELRRRTPIQVTMKRMGAYLANTEIKVTEKNLMIDGRQAAYEEIDALDKESGRRSKDITIDIVDNLNPGLKIVMNATYLKAYEMNRDKFECFLKSIRFDK